MPSAASTPKQADIQPYSTEEIQAVFGLCWDPYLNPDILSDFRGPRRFLSGYASSDEDILRSARSAIASFAALMLFGHRIVRHTSAAGVRYLNINAEGEVYDVTAETHVSLARTEVDHTFHFTSVGSDPIISDKLSERWPQPIEFGDLFAEYPSAFYAVTLANRMDAALKGPSKGNLPFLTAEGRSRWLDESDFSFVIDQPQPWGISPGHQLICPKRPVSSYFDLEMQEIEDIHRLMLNAKSRVDSDLNPDGYNIGINSGIMAGQTVFHCHVHLIPRFEGDHPNPRGGIRAVIPGKQDY